MLEINYEPKTGWSPPKIVPYGKVRIHPAATSLHYGLSCYNGMNILQNKDTKKTQAFRPFSHINEFFDSSNHLDLPLFDTQELFNSMKTLV